ncbi:hypothetical protein R3P38DRAFT_2904942 [Favolaschia claudopus]|uniref:Uncharacterized protein n=1 Tax=Favolaschia claudopus TaxID=2862362 RepID=A0AAW0CGK2_9AGAR
MSRILAISVAAISLFSYVVADSENTIIVPFADPQAISADILGVDSKGRTTWQLRQGAYTGTWTDPQGSFPGTATLVEGADYASFTYVVKDSEGDFAVAGECTYQDGNVQICTVARSVGTEAGTAVETDTVTPFGVQVAATGAPAGPGNSASASGPSGSVPSGSSPAPTGAPPNSSVRTSASGFGVLAALLLASYFV